MGYKTERGVAHSIVLPSVLSPNLDSHEDGYAVKKYYFRIKLNKREAVWEVDASTFVYESIFDVSDVNRKSTD